MPPLRMDWVTFGLPIKYNNLGEPVGAYDVGKLLTNDSDMWIKRNQYGTSLKSEYGCYWMENSGWAEKPQKLEVSGVGCDKLMATLPVLREEYSHHGLSPEYNLDGSCVDDVCSVTRIDFAMDFVMTRSEWREICIDTYLRGLDGVKSSKVRRITTDGKGLAQTTYWGDRSEGKYFRIYNKSLEDPEYQYIDSNGDVVDIGEDKYIIRYELQIKRRVNNPKSGRQVSEPLRLFDYYYSQDPSDFDKLVDYIRKSWAYGLDKDDIVFCDDFWDADVWSHLSTKYRFCCEQGTDFAEMSDVELAEYVKENKHCEPRTFDKTLQYFVKYWGHYLPYIVADERLWRRCLLACWSKHLYEPDIRIDYHPSGVQLEEIGYFDLDDDFPWDLPSDVKYYDMIGGKLVEL